MVSSSAGGVLNGHGPLDQPLNQFFIQAIIIILTSRLLSIPLKKIRQPTVIAEVIGGIILGPSVFGYIPGFTQTIFPDSSKPFLGTVSSLGLTLYLFLVGLELDVQAMLKNAKRCAAISLAGIIVPFSFGVGASFYLYEEMVKHHPGEKVAPFTSFFLFTGVAMSITAFPVLARILTELNLLSTDVGIMTISSAAVDDAMAWSLLALVVSIINAKDNLTALWVFLLVIAYAVALFVLFRPLFIKAIDYVHAKNSYLLKQLLLATTFIFIFISGWITDIIGVDSIFGAFIFGLIIPPSHDYAIELTEKLEDFVSIVFLPLYFAFSGLKTQINSLSDGTSWLMLLVVTIVAVGGKVTGCTLAARLTGLKWRESASVGFLMNTKGLVELIVLNLGLDAKVIDVRIFTIMVMMALLTTFMTTPIISYIYPSEKRSYINAAQNAAAPGSPVATTPGTPLPDMGSYKLLVGLDKVEDVSSISSLLPLFNGKDEKDTMALHCIHHKESSELTSNVMFATQTTTAMKVDPVLKMMNVFGQLMGIQVHPHLAFGSTSSYIREIADLSKNELINLVLVPYKKPTFGNSSSGGLSDLPKYSSSSVGFYVDALSGHILTKSNTKRRILVPFVGGQSQRDALVLALRFAHHENVDVDVVVLTKEALPESGATLPESLDSEDAAAINNALQVTNSMESVHVRYQYSVTDIKQSVVDTLNGSDYSLLLLGYYNETSHDSLLGSLGSHLLDNVSKTSMLIIKASSGQNAPTTPALSVSHV